MKEYNSYAEAELVLIRQALYNPDFVTSTTNELLGVGFVLLNPGNNKNTHSNYQYADAFFKWLLSGEKQLSDELIELNPWVKRFVTSAGLPENFSAAYSWKIKEDLPHLIEELKHNSESRRAYANILRPEDKVILRAKTTHEYPCSIGFQLFIREGSLHFMVNMRSNNLYAVMPYDVYNFTSLQLHLAKELGVKVGYYYHMINNAHLYKGDVRRLKEQSLYL